MKSALLLCSLLCSTAAVDSPSAAACKDANTCKDDEVSLLQTVSEVRKYNVLDEQNQAAEAALGVNRKQERALPGAESNAEQPAEDAEQLAQGALAIGLSPNQERELVDLVVEKAKRLANEAETTKPVEDKDQLSEQKNADQQTLLEDANKLAEDEVALGLKPKQAMAVEKPSAKQLAEDAKRLDEEADSDEMDARELKTTLKEISDKETKWEKNIKLNVLLKRGEGLKNRDAWGWGASDPFCEVKLAVCAGCEGTKDKTKRMSPVVINSNNPTWNWKYETHDWNHGDRIMFTCYDHDTIGQNDLLGTAMLELEKRGESFKDRQIQLQTRGYLVFDITWEECSKGDCEDVVTTMAKISDYVYKFNTQAGSYHLALQDDIAPSNPEFVEDHIALYKKKGSTDCVLAFSGGNDKGDWAQNLAATAAKDVCGIKKIHKGFLAEVTNFFKSKKMVLFSGVINSICGGKVISVGHSVGGAVATIAAGCLNSPGGVKAIPEAHKDVKSFTVKALYTIGAPAVSSPQITDKGGKCFPGRRTYNYDSRTYDIVPYIASKMGYVHPKVEALEMVEKNDGKLILKTYRCYTPQAQSYPYNSTQTRMNRVPSTSAHTAATYIHRAKKLLTGP